MFRGNRAGACLFAALVVVLASSNAQAQEPQIGVTVTVDVKAMTGLWEPRTTVVVKKIADKLAGRLKAQFRHWSFTTNVPASRFQCAFRVYEEGHAVWASLTFMYQNRDLLPPWTERLGSEGHPILGEIYQSEEKAATVIPDLFARELFNGRHSRAIEATFKEYVPLGVGASVLQTTPEPRLAVALKWDDHPTLTCSRFKLECQWPESDRDPHLTSRGKNMHAPYSGYRALVVTPDIKPANAKSRDELRRVRFGGVFLVEVNPCGYIPPPARGAP